MIELKEMQRLLDMPIAKMPISEFLRILSKSVIETICPNCGQVTKWIGNETPPKHCNHCNTELY